MKRFPTIVNCLALATVAAVLAGSLARFAAAEDEPASGEVVPLDDGLKQLAEHCRTYFQANGVEEVVLGPFVGPARTSTSGRIETALASHLGDDVAVVDTGAYRLSGRFRGQRTDEGRFAIVVSATICDALGDELCQMNKLIFTSEEEGLALFGATAELPLSAEAAEGESADEALRAARTDAVVTAIAEPAAVLTADVQPSPDETTLSVVRAATDSPYGIEILLKTPDGAQPLSTDIVGGLAQVAVARGQEYAVRLINDSDEPAGVALTIDGVNVLAFSRNPGFRNLGKWVLPARSVGLIEGWHEEASTFRSFVVTPYSESAAASVGNADGIGTVTAVFTAAFAGDDVPADEPRLGAIERDESGTGLGAPLNREVRTLRANFGVVRSSVSVRYARPDLSDLPE